MKPFLVSEFVMLGQLLLGIVAICPQELRRSHFAVRAGAVLCLLVLLGIMSSVPFGVVNHAGSNWFKTLFFALTLGFYFPALLITYNVTPWQALFYCASGYAVQNLTSSLANLFRSISSAASGLWPLGLATIYIPLSTLLVYPLYCHFYAKKSKDTGLPPANDAEQIFIMLVVVMAVIGIDIGIKDVAKQFPIELSSLLLLRTAHILICAFVLFAQYKVLYGSRLLADREVQRRLAEERERQYQISRRNMEAVNIRCHDLKHQIHRLATGNEIVDGIALSEIADEIGIYDSIVETGNPALDTILTEKSLLCTNDQITLGVIADGQALGFLRASEIYSLFGNALDNAIEATRPLSNQEKRVISLNVFRRNAFVVISMENYYEGERRLCDGLPETTKEDRESHGFGMQSIRHIAEKHDGTVTVTAESGVFKLTVLLACPEG